MKILDKPIITTSINKKGSAPLNRTDDIEKNYPEIPIFEDQNQTENHSIGSTIIMLKEDKIKLVRKGDGIFPL